MSEPAGPAASVPAAPSPGSPGHAPASPPSRPAGSSPDDPPVAGPPSGGSGQRPVPARRAFLRGALGVGFAGAAAAGAGAGYAYRASRPIPAAATAAETAQAGVLPAVPFHGRYQAGILPGSQRQTAVISFSVTAAGRGELRALFQTITDRARFLAAGGTAPPVGISAPPSDSGILGPAMEPNGLTVTVGVGASLFDDRYGLAALRPARLTQMQPFPDDNLDPAQCNGDLSLQLNAGSADTVLHALRDITRHTRGGMQILWRIDGFTSPPRPAGTTPRNLLGFMDGIANPDAGSPAAMDELVWVTSSASHEPAWTVGGSYQVIRLIRMLVEFWDRVDVFEQENMIGRRRATGAPLDANSEFAIPNYPVDPSGAVIPLTAHIRLANPRTPQSGSSRILRRGYNYDRGIDDVGNLDQGLIFTCYQQDIKRQFEAVQTRLTGEPLVDYISPFGGGYFYALPGVRNASDYYGRALLT
ncbi:MAG TPA: Dyp-type peroxidase [Streptosporangiaceae bacterium]